MVSLLTQNYDFTLWFQVKFLMLACVHGVSLSTQTVAILPYCNTVLMINAWQAGSWSATSKTTCVLLVMIVSCTVITT